MSSAEPRPAVQHSALFVSAVLHPFVVVPATVLIRSGNWRASALIAALTILPVLAVTAVRVRRGAWTDFDVSHRGQRSGLYFVALPLTVVAALVVPPQFARGTWVAAAMLLAGLLLGPLLKTSLHMMFGAYCAVLTGSSFPLTVPLLVALLLLLGWSRRRLERHEWREIAAGTAIGVAGGIAAIL